MKRAFTAIITRGQIAYVAYCSELGVASQGKTVEKAKKNLAEAIGLYLEEAADSKLAKPKSPIVTTIRV